MDNFCSSEFWDWDLTWNTTTPIFTTCFLKTALIWGPALFFWIFAPAEVYFVATNKAKEIPWSPLSIMKLMAAVSLLALSAVDMSYQVFRYTRTDVRPVEYYTPFVLLVTMIAVLFTMLWMRRRGVITSGVLFLFWFLLSVGTGIGYYVALQKTFNQVFDYDEDNDYYHFTTTVLYFGISASEFVLHCFAERRKHPRNIPQRENPEERASFVSRVTFWWFNPMVLVGYKKPLTSADVWELAEQNRSENLWMRFDKHCSPLLESIKSRRRQQRSSRNHWTKDSGASLSSPDCDEDSPVFSIVTPLLRTFGWDLFVAGSLKVIGCVVIFANPILLDLLITFVSSDEPYWKGVCYGVGMFLASMLESLIMNQYEFRIMTAAMRIRSSTISVIYRKALTLSAAARRHYTVGEVVNLMAVDTQRFMDYIQRVFNLITAPIQICIAVYILWQQLGVATLGGVAILILMVPVNAAITLGMKKYQALLMKEKDRRTKLMNEILSGIKVLKLYAWENSFIQKVMGIRSKEIESLRAQAYLNGAIAFTFLSVPYLVSLASFATFVLLDPANVLDANRAFVSLSLFNILRSPTALLPMTVTFTAMFLVSLKRINRFLQSGEIDPEVIQHDPTEKNAVVIESGTFSWTQNEEPTLKDLDLHLKEGSLVAVVGQVGAGKSSLISALLGEMVKCSGRVNVKGSVAYVPQQAWIQNATLRKNVLFTKPYDAQPYGEVIEACALMPDLEILPGGDLTEIGEKGVNLSGGQKQRVNLARAIYNDADIYYLDDPLSAVDVHVGNHIFEKVIGPRGILKKKTRILVTHRIGLLPKVDTIVVLQGGQVSEVGSYKELLVKKGAFADFLTQYLEKATEDVVPPEELNLIQEIAATVGVSPEITRQLSERSDGGKESGSNRWMRSKSISSPEAGGRILTEVEGKRAKKRVDENLEKRSKLVEKEAMEVGSVKASVYLDYFRCYGTWNAVFTLAFYTLQTIFSLGSSLWLSAWSDDALDPEKVGDPHQRDLRLGVYGGLGAGEVSFTLLSSILMALACLRASRILHDGMLCHVLRAPMSFFDTTPTGRTLNRFSKDIDTTDVTIRFNFRLLLSNMVRAIPALVIIALETPFFILACIPLAVLYYSLQKFYVPTSRQLKRLESTTRSPIYSHFAETIAGSTCIRAFQAEETFVHHSNGLVDINNESYYASLAASRWLCVGLEFLGYSIVLMSALFAVLTRDSLSPGMAGLAVSYALQITTILNMLVRATADVETNIVAVERCLEYTRTPTEAEWSNDETKPESSWPDNGLVHFDSYATRYREGLQLVLKNITCSIGPKERCGIVGRTGAGKSSLTLALFRVIEADRGTISIDGLDIATLGLHDLRSRLTVIPQDPVLFTGTLRMNLDPFEKYSDDELWVALEQAHLKDFVGSLERGLQHEIAEGGENLSAGQRQLVCLARALLRMTKILVMDEATAAVDVETDELIQSTIRTEFNDCTVLTVAHRLNTVMDYDKIIVLDRGEIKEIDRPENLLKDEKSVFFEMAKEAGLVSINSRDAYTSS